MTLRWIADIFSSATLRLTLWYMAIAMAISLVFSFSVYRASTRELEAGLKRQARMYQIIPRFRDLTSSGGVVPSPEEQLTLARQHLMVNLAVLNLVILALVGAASYWFAKQTLSPIEAALEAQSRFTADASHELRTPLTAMKTEIEVALRDPKLSPGEARQLLQSNLEEIAKLETLSNGLLKLAQGNGQTLSKQPLKLKLVVSEAVSRLSTNIKARQVKLVHENLANLKVSGDHDSLVELLVILLDNAIKYSDPGTTINVSTRARGHFAEVSVTDHGHGIKTSDLPHIFDRFYRADPSRSKKQITGYGLGLSIAQKIVEAHGGKVSVVSTPGKGSTFTVKLPLTEPKDVQAQTV